MAGCEKFLARLDESMNTAADFYSEFKGAVIIELSEEWAKKGINDAFSCLPGYIGMHKCIRRLHRLLKRKGSRHRLTI